LPFPSLATEDEADDHVPSPLDEVFALLEFDIDIAKNSCIDIELIQSILDHLHSTLLLLDANSLKTFCQDVIGEKGGEPAKRSARFIALLMEICRGQAVHAHSSSNMRNVKGVRVARRDGSKEVWTFTKASFDTSKIAILSSIMLLIGNDMARILANILALETEKKISSGLEGITIAHIASNSAYFVLKCGTPSDDASLSFRYQAYSKADVPVGNERKISWTCSKDQRTNVVDLMKTLGAAGLRGDVVETRSLNYTIQMCLVLDTIIDPFKLGVRIDKENGMREESGDDATPVEGDEADSETQEDGTEPITPFQLSRMLMEEIDGESESIRYDFGKKRMNPKKTTRVQNGLATLEQVRTLLSFAYGWLKPQGAHFDAPYAKFLSTKLSTELKSFLSNGNSLYWYTRPHFNILVLVESDLLQSVDLRSSVYSSTQSIAFLCTFRMRLQPRSIVMGIPCGTIPLSKNET
jgi:hypothetical protein